MRESGVDRKDVFVTTKIPTEVKKYEGAKSAIETSLSNLEIEYIDLMLTHAPKPWPELFAGSDKTYSEHGVFTKCDRKATEPSDCCGDGSKI